MTFITGMSDFAIELSKALGEDPDKVCGISLECLVGSVVTVTIQRYVDNEEAEKIIETVKKQAWVVGLPPENALNE